MTLIILGTLAMLISISAIFGTIDYAEDKSDPLGPIANWTRSFLSALIWTVIVVAAVMILFGSAYLVKLGIDQINA